MPAPIVGLVHNSNSEPMLGYTVVWELFEAFATPGSGLSWRPARREVPLERHGDLYGFRFDLAGDAASGETTVRGPSRFEVAAPTGEVVGSLVLDLPRTTEVIQTGKVALGATALPPGRIDPSPNPTLGLPDRLAGLVLQVSDGSRVPAAQVLLWSKSDGGPQLLVTAQTDPRGYFFCDRPQAKVSEAFATVAGFKESVPIRLDAEGRLPKRVVIGLTTRSQAPAPNGCGCDGTASLPYAADASDLATSDAYGADLGAGHCVDLTVPNRALEEFSYHVVLRTTDPEIKGLTLPPPSRQTQLTGLIDSFQAYGVTLDPADLDPIALPGASTAIAVPVRDAVARRADLPTSVLQAVKQIDLRTEAAALATWSKKSAGRSTLDASNPIDWDDEPTFYQATTIAHGHLLHFKQVWKSFGFSLGPLLYSLPLAPLQKKQIAIVDWERRERASRSETLESADSLQASVSQDSLVQDIVNATLQETTRGASDAKTSGWGAAGGGAGAIPVGPIPMPLIFGIGGGASNASSTAWQDSGRDLAANAMSTLSNSVTQNASALRRQRATVVQQISQGETSTVTTDVVANNNHCHSLTIQYFEVLRHFIVEHFLADVRECLFIPLLMSRFDEAKALRWREPLRRGLWDRRLVDAFDALERQLNPAFYADFPVDRYADDPIVEIWGSLAISFVLPRPDDKDDGSFDDTSWQSYAKLLWDKAESIFDQYLLGQTDADRDKAFKQVVAPRLAEALVDQLKFSWRNDATAREEQVKLDSTLLADYAEGVPLAVSIRMRGVLPADMTRAAVNAFIIKSTVALPAYSKVVVKSGTIRYRTDHLEHVLVSDNAINNDLQTGTDEVELACPLAAAELRNPRDDDKEAATKLVTHLNEHLEHFHKMIWWHMDHDRRYMLLDGFVAPNANGRSVASVVENRVIAICGNCLVMPVAPGFVLDPAYSRPTSDGRRPRDLLEHYAPTAPQPPVRLSLPTKGVYAEAVMGACNSCEKIDDSRFWKFEEHPSPDEPTPIASPSTDSRAQPAPNLQPSPLSSPIIAMQNAPPAPAPSALASALQLLGTQNLFNDVTGLAGNQQNASDALKSALSSATAMGGLAAANQLAEMKNLAHLQKQKAAIENSDSVIGHIVSARDAKLISDSDAQALAKQALGLQVGTPDATSAAPTPADKMIDMVTQAVANGRGASATVSNGDGTASATVSGAVAPAPDLAPLFEQDPSKPENIDTLAAIVQTASMCLSSTAGSGGSPITLSVRPYRTEPVIADTCATSSTNWIAKVLVEKTGMTAATYYQNGNRYPTVFQPIEWCPVTVTGLPAVASLTLPLTLDYEIAHQTVTKTKIDEDSVNGKLYRLGTNIDYGRLHVFGYVINKKGAMRPMTPSEAADINFRTNALKFDGDGSVSIVITVELVLCQPDAFYEPSGWLQVARLYPLLGFWCSSTFGTVGCDIRLTPPAETQPSLFTDMNGPLPTAATLGAYKWSNRFAHYVPDARVRGSFTVVDQALVQRINKEDRGVYDKTTGGYDPTPVTKLERQQAFDAIVMAAVRQYTTPAGEQESITAPLTDVDALHIHWRWGDSFTKMAQWGWGSTTLTDISGGTPHAQRGAPQVPWNQSISVFFDQESNYLAYQATANAEPKSAQKWQIFMHHGCGYVVSFSFGSGAILAAEIPEIPNGQYPTWNDFYFYNRYTTTTDGQIIPRVRESESNFANLEQM